jgi:hypothetical protein
MHFLMMLMPVNYVKDLQEDKTKKAIAFGKQQPLLSFYGLIKVNGTSTRGVITCFNKNVTIVI